MTRACRREYQRKYQRQRRLALGVMPHSERPVPEKPAPSLRTSDPALYMRLYMRWWRRFATCDEADKWWM